MQNIILARQGKGKIDNIRWMWRVRIYAGLSQALELASCGKEERSQQIVKLGWLPGMDSNHELDKILRSRNLLILQSRRSRQKRQKAGFWYKIGTKYFDPLFVWGSKKGHLGVSIEQAIKGGAHPVPVRQRYRKRTGFVNSDWIFPWDLLKTIKKEVYSSIS
jgi:hypothetical protein